MTFARIARDLGAREMAVNSLAAQMQSAMQDQSVDLAEPFLAPIERFDGLAPGERPADWVIAALLEAIERFAAFSSFYTGAGAAARLEMIDRLGFGDEEMSRRLELVRSRFRSMAAG
jgi:ribosomal protein S12 methylthiotransferase accessory factor YcaO